MLVHTASSLYSGLYSGLPVWVSTVWHAAETLGSMSPDTPARPAAFGSGLSGTGLTLAALPAGAGAVLLLLLALALMGTSPQETGATEGNDAETDDESSAQNPITAVSLVTLLAGMPLLGIFGIILLAAIVATVSPDAAASGTVPSIPFPSSRELTPTERAYREIPPHILTAYREAAIFARNHETGCSIRWPTLAAVGYLELRHGTGQENDDPYIGNMQIAVRNWAHQEDDGKWDPSKGAKSVKVGDKKVVSDLSGWFGAGTDGNNDAIANIHDPIDNIFGAAILLCRYRISDNPRKALRHYSGGADAYAEQVEALEKEYAYWPISPGQTSDTPENPATPSPPRPGRPGQKMYCPVDGKVSFVDSWHAPRSGGRKHKGVDMFAAMGTPLLAVTDGVIFKHSPTDRGLGGITLWLRDKKGNTYYYAHNSRNVKKKGDRVKAGQVIAYVGHTGNAATTPPHVHWENHPKGGAAVNPYPLVHKLCPKH